MFHFSSKKREKFDNIISLGYKCETAYSIKAICGDAVSSLFNWVHITDVHNLISFLENPSLLLSKGIEFDNKYSFMYRDCALDFRYHSKHEPSYFQTEDVLQRIQEDTQEVISRITYLKDKFLSTIKSEQKNLFIMCFKKNIDKNEINDILGRLSELIYQLSGNKESKLLVIFERPYIGFRKLKKYDNIIIKKTWKFAPDSFAHGLNFEFWANVYSGFEFSFCKTTNYQKNIEKFIEDVNLGTIHLPGKRFAIKDKYYDKIAPVLHLKKRISNKVVLLE